MEFYTKDGLLLLVQVDHLCGEMLGSVIDSFYEAGAKNVQIVSSVTKKNRPAYMIFIDTPLDKAEEMEEVIVRECGSSGWHRISTQHRYTRVSVLKKNIKVRADGKAYDFTAEGKVIDDDQKNARPEYDNCAALKHLLKEKEGINIPLKQLHSYLTEVFHEDKRELVI